MMKSIALLGTVTAIALAAPAANAATTIHVGTYPTSTSSAYFFITGTAADGSITANFGDTYAKGVTFDDIFDFTLPTDGVGGGSVSTSFSSAKTKLKISSVKIDGVSYTASAAAMGITGIPITAGVLNTIEVTGTSGSSLGTFAGTATFTPTAVPEPATWATFLLGFGFMGFALRRKLAPSFKTA